MNHVPFVTSTIQCQLLFNNIFLLFLLPVPSNHCDPAFRERLGRNLSRLPLGRMRVVSVSYSVQCRQLQTIAGDLPRSVKRGGESTQHFLACARDFSSPALRLSSFSRKAGRGAWIVEVTKALCSQSPSAKPNKRLSLPN